MPATPETAPTSPKSSPPPREGAPGSDARPPETGTPAPRPGFRAGARSLFASLAFLMREPKSWPAAMVPAILLLFFFIVLGVAAIEWLYPLLQDALPAGTGGIGRFLNQAAAGLGAVTAALLGFLLALLVTPALSAPALERLVALREERLGLPGRPPLGFFAGLLVGLRSQLVGAALALPILFGLFLVELGAPALGVVTLPLKAFVAAAALAWNLLDYPLTLSGVSVRDRLGILRRYPAAILGFGLSFSLLFSLPCFGILALPAGVVAAAELLASMAAHDPEAFRRVGFFATGPLR